ncbi:MAG: glycosyltransferase family 87 protein, partial [Pseudomonadota bacterium]
WVAAREGLFGDPLIPYDRTTFDPAQKVFFPEAGFFAFFYPPHYQLMLLPLGALPFFGSLFVWQIATFAFVAWVMVRVTRNAKLTIMLAISFPAAFLTFAHGQNAFLSAALFATGLYLLPRRPVLAGVMFGLLTFKPQLGILIPLALLVSLQWKAILSATLTTVALVVISALVLGTEVWAAFLAQTSVATQVLNEGTVGWAKMISVYSALRGFGLPYGLAMSAHALVVIAVSAIILIAWRREVRVAWELKCAMLLIGALIVTPFGLNYDLYILAPAAAFYLAAVPWAKMDGVERNCLIAGFFLPVTVLLTMTAGYSLAPWIVLLVFGAMARTAFGSVTNRQPIAKPKPVSA